MDWRWDEMALSEESDFLAAAMDWHFSDETGSPFWVKLRDSLDFDPRRDINSYSDLSMFPSVVHELRDVRVEDLIPRGYGDATGVVGAYDSGGTTGAPKRVLLHADWLDRSLRWKSDRLDDRGLARGLNWLLIAPTGPHVFGRLMTELTAMRGGIPFTVDLDPRWVRRCLADGDVAAAGRYAEHIVDQAEFVLATQDIGVLVATPPILERIAERDAMVETVNKKVDMVMWGGASLDPDSRRILQNDVFGQVDLCGQYGSTLIMGGSMERPDGRESERCVFDPCAPFTTFSVVDPDTRDDVDFGERGQVVMNHISKSLFLPNNLERDLATRIAAPVGTMGSSVADVAPVASFDDTVVIEGVY